MKRLALLALFAISVGACAGPASSPAAPSAAPIAVTLADFKIAPSAVTSGTSLSIAVMSNGPTPHNMTIRDANDVVVAHSKDLRAGESDSVAVQLAPGSYTIFCAFAGHESLGMHSALTVTAP